MTRPESEQLHEMSERLARLEEREKARERREKDQAQKIDEMYALLLQAKGARWAIIAAAGISGFIAAKSATLLQFLMTK